MKMLLGQMVRTPNRSDSIDRRKWRPLSFDVQSQRHVAYDPAKPSSISRMDELDKSDARDSFQPRVIHGVHRPHAKMSLTRCSRMATL
jgi:hypothetical protein